jgi:hypothetical protein
MRCPVIDYDRNGHAGGAVMGCFFPDETTRRRGRYLATGEEQGLTGGGLRGGSEDAEEAGVGSDSRGG